MDMNCHFTEVETHISKKKREIIHSKPGKCKSRYHDRLFYLHGFGTS